MIRPRPTAATSVPGLLALFQNEWDALMLETHTLKEHLAATRTVRVSPTHPPTHPPTHFEEEKEEEELTHPPTHPPTHPLIH